MIDLARRYLGRLTCLTLFLAVASCKPTAEIDEKVTTKIEGELLRVGTIVVTQADLDFELKEKHGDRQDEETKKKALDDLIGRARLSQAALDAGLDGDPMTRAEIARILATRLKEESLSPKLKAASAQIADDRLRELYTAQSARFQSPEKRQVAVLWLNPGADPGRAKMYEDKMTQARDWFFNESDLAEQIDKGFSVLAVDYSEHTPTRFKEGVLGWLDANNGGSDWNRAVTKITFALKETGEVSPVTIEPEGVFLVRLMAIQPAKKQSFEEVRSSLAREEQTRLRKQLEDEFYQGIENRYSVESP